MSAQLADIQRQLDGLKNGSVLGTSVITSSSLVIPDSDPESSSSALIASNSAALSQVDKILNQVQDDTVATMSSLMVTDKANINNLAVTGTIQNGLLTINGLDDGAATINSLGVPLKIQNALTANVEFLGGQIVMDTKGNIKVSGEVTTKKLNINTDDKTSASAGTATLKSGDTSIIIHTKAVTDKSLIFITPKTKTTSPLSVTSQDSGNSFTVEISNAQNKDIDFNWLMVN
jgi:hypothetical protein